MTKAAGAADEPDPSHLQRVLYSVLDTAAVNPADPARTQP